MSFLKCVLNLLHWFHLLFFFMLISVNIKHKSMLFLIYIIINVYDFSHFCKINDATTTFYLQEIRNLTSLQQLDLSDNNIGGLPPELVWFLCILIQIKVRFLIGHASLTMCIGFLIKFPFFKVLVSMPLVLKTWYTCQALKLEVD